MSVQNDDEVLIRAGYKPQLRRSIRFLSSFAVAFSLMSVLVGVFANYSYLLGKSGPFGIWTWLLVGAGQTMVALVFAEMVGRIPLTGALYNWNCVLANPFVGWMTGWLLVFAYAVGNVGVVVAILAPLQTFLGCTFNTGTILCVGVGSIILQTLINVYGVNLAAHTNKIAVIAEIIALILFGTVIGAVSLLHHEVNAALITTIPDQPRPYLPAFLMASLMAAWTMVAFESSSDLSEETLNAGKITPTSTVLAVLTTTVLGFVFVAILTMAIPDVVAVAASTDPVSAIVSYHLGAIATKIFLFFVLLALFATSMVGITFVARILFAMARDKRFVASRHLATISPHKVPATATLAVAAVEATTFIVARDLTDLYAMPVVLIAVAYLMTMVSFAFGLKKLPPAKNFTMGRWYKPVAILASLWLVAEICILTVPAEFHSVAMESGGVIIASILLYFVMGRVRKG